MATARCPECGAETGISALATGQRVQCAECGTHFLYAGESEAPETAEDVEREEEESREEEPREWEVESLQAQADASGKPPGALLRLHLLGVAFQRWNVLLYARIVELWPKPAAKLLSWLVPAGAGALLALGLGVFLPPAAAYPLALIVGALTLAYALITGRTLVFGRRQETVPRAMDRLDAHMADLRTALHRAGSIKSAKRRALGTRRRTLLRRLLAAPVVLKAGLCAVVALLVVGAALLAIHLAGGRAESGPDPAPKRVASGSPAAPESAPAQPPVASEEATVRGEEAQMPVQAPQPEPPDLSRGMAPAEAQALLGEPDGESRIVRAGKAHLWWHYDDGLELRFVDGKLTEWERTAVSVPGPGDEPEPPEDEEAIAYIERVTVRDVRVVESVFGDRGVTGEILNGGDRPLADVQLTATCLGADGTPLSRERVHAFASPAEAEPRGRGQPLAPGCSRRFTVKLTEAPADWDGRAVIVVDGVNFFE